MKVVNITPIGKKKVYDIAVDEVEHYILENGVVSHNSGLLYSCNQAFIIGKSQEKEGSDLVGYNFIINIEKSRYVKEKSKFPFTVTFDGGIQKYSGLMDIAIDGGFVVKPSQGWYAKVNKTTGEIGEKMRLSKTQTDEFWQPILQNKEFKEYVKQKYEIAHGAIMEHCSLVEEEEIND